MESWAVQEKRVEMVEKGVWDMPESMAEMELTSISLQKSTSLASLLILVTLVQMEVREDQAVVADLVVKEVMVVREEKVGMVTCLPTVRAKEVMAVMVATAVQAVMATTVVPEEMVATAVIPRYTI